MLYVFIALFTCATSERLQITIYYDALDPVSTDVILNQLFPTVNGFLKGSIDLRMVPFSKMTGHKNNNEEWEWNCMKGPINCYANKIHACIFGKIPHLDHQMEYVACLLKHTRNLIEMKDYPTSSCISGGELDTVTKCADQKGPQNEGDQLLASYMNEVLKLKTPLRHSPGFSVNNEFNDSFADIAKKDFAGLVCKNLKDSTSEVCEALKNAQNSALTTPLTSFAFLFSFLLYSFS